MARQRRHQAGTIGRRTFLEGAGSVAAAGLMIGAAAPRTAAGGVTRAPLMASAAQGASADLVNRLRTTLTFQISVDVGTIAQGLDVARASLAGGVDIVEMGTPLLKNEGVSNVVPDEVERAMEKIEAACAARSIPVIPVVGSPDEYATALGRGHKIACCNTDFHLFMSAAADQLAACRAKGDS